ncbi:MAG: hypothetical protein IPM45_15660 [Acidimicrobiales bacterium]|nr:hypothetical protein [Acidimicrobiales bacterium]
MAQKRQVLAGKGTSLWPDPFAGPWAVTVHYAEVDGRVEPVGLDVRSFREVDGGAVRPAAPRGRLAPITATVVRSLPTAALVRATRRFLVESARKEAKSEKRPAAQRRALTTAADRLDVPEGDELTRAAAVYRQAWRSGDPAPTRAVAEALGVGRNVAAKRVARCRRLGLLPPTERRRAGLGGAR